MVDIHCHPLPDTDDGAKSFDIAVEMCKMAAANGTTHLVATPHCNYSYEYDLEANRAKVKELQAAVGPSPQLLLGCDFHLSYDNIERLLLKPREYSINYTEYILVEFGEHFIPDQIDNAFYKIECAGLIPILTHPERNPVFQRKPDLLYYWVRKGCLAQITAKSYTGGFGSTAMKFSEQWLDQNLVNFFASDAHDLEYRPPVLSECYKKLSGAKGEEIANLLLTSNPEAVINGKPLPPGPEPIDPAAKKKRKWFSFLDG